MNAGGLLIVLLCGLIVLALSAGTMVAAVYSWTAKDARRGFKLGAAAVIGSAVAIILSTPFWLVFLRGKDTHGQPLHYPGDWPIAALVILEAAVLVVALSGMLRQRARRKSA